MYPHSMFIKQFSSDFFFFFSIFTTKEKSLYYMGMFSFMGYLTVFSKMHSTLVCNIFDINKYIRVISRTNVLYCSTADSLNQILPIEILQQYLKP